MNKLAQDYMDKGTGEQRALFERLHLLITDLYPQAENKVSYGLLRYFIGKKGVWLGYWKQGVSLYSGYPELINAFKEKHPQLKYGKGCINFKLTDEIPEKDVKAFLKLILA
jgi:uncharacterized protein YdhG (YjbR/CyaY superfamily)